MGVEQLYFIIGPLLGCILMGPICVARCILRYEWIFKLLKKEEA